MLLNIFRIYHETLGGHVRMRVFAGQREGALGKCGDLCMRIDEFDDFRAALTGKIEFRYERPKPVARNSADEDK